MESIEKRLRRVHDDPHADGHYAAVSKGVNYFDIGYTTGSHDQYNLDIDKARKWLEQNASNYIVIGNTDFGCCEADIDTDELIDDFCKAMEE